MPQNKKTIGTNHFPKPKIKVSHLDKNIPTTPDKLTRPKRLIKPKAKTATIPKLRFAFSSKFNFGIDK